MKTDPTQHITVAEELSSAGGGSALQKYKEIFVGRDSNFALVKYELLTSLLSLLPGALGFVLRKIFYKQLFAALGRGPILGSHLVLRCPGQIYLGNNVVIDENVTLDAKGRNSFIRTGNEIFIGKNTIFSCASAGIALGDEVSIGPHSYIRASRGDVQIGSYVTMGAHTVIISGNPDYSRLDIPMMKQEGSAKGISIGDDVWIGVGVRIIDGVEIGSGSVIGAGAVVTKSLPEYSIAAGVPAKVLKSRK